MKYDLPKGFEDRMKRLLGKEYIAFLSGYERPLKRGLRVNTLKCSASRFAELFPHTLVPSPFSSYGFIVEEDFRAGSDPFHHAGAYYMQEPSAMSAVTILDPRPYERVLDLCAAPGGKSTQIAAALQGSGLLWANEFIRSRAHILAQNIERCGVRNAVVSCMDVSTLCSRLAGFFDAVLVDAPCSGEGMFRKEPEALSQWSVDNIRLCAKRQEEILRAAADAVSPGGRLVYSTCTFAPEENECQIVKFLLNHPDFTLVDTNVSFGRPGFSLDKLMEFDEKLATELDLSPENTAFLALEKTRRIFPEDGGEGHYIALLMKKDSNCHKIATNIAATSNTCSKDIMELYNKCFAEPLYGVPCTVGNFIRLIPEGLPDLKGLGVITAGVSAAEICKNRLEPCHALFMAATNSGSCISLLDLKLDDPRLTAFLRGEIVDAPDCVGWTAVAVDGIVTGYGKASNGILKNHYPKGLRLLSR